MLTVKSRHYNHYYNGATDRGIEEILIPNAEQKLSDFLDKLLPERKKVKINLNRLTREEAAILKGRWLLGLPQHPEEFGVTQIDWEHRYKDLTLADYYIVMAGGTLPKRDSIGNRNNVVEEDQIKWL